MENPDKAVRLVLHVSLPNGTTGVKVCDSEKQIRDQQRMLNAAWKQQLKYEVFVLDEQQVGKNYFLRDLADWRRFGASQR